MWAETKKEDRKLNFMFEAACMLAGILYAFIIFEVALILMWVTDLSEFAIAAVGVIAAIIIWVPAELLTIKGLEKIKNE